MFDILFKHFIAKVRIRSLFECSCLSAKSQFLSSWTVYSVSARVQRVRFMCNVMCNVFMQFNAMQKLNTYYAKVVKMSICANYVDDDSIFLYLSTVRILLYFFAKKW